VAKKKHDRGLMSARIPHLPQESEGRGLLGGSRGGGDKAERWRPPCLDAVEERRDHARLELVPANDLATLFDLCVSQALSDFRLEPINREGRAKERLLRTTVVRSDAIDEEYTPVLWSLHGAVALDDLAVLVVLDRLCLPWGVPQPMLLLVGAVAIHAGLLLGRLLLARLCNVRQEGCILLLLVAILAMVGSLVVCR
jgi:hypothetical protein